MYAQSSIISEMFSWTGFGFGGYGAGNAYFPGWFNRTLNSQNQTVGAVPLPVAAAFKLQKELVVGTPQKLQLGRSSVDGFVVLAGRTETGHVVKVLLNNYQVDYDVLREITAILVSSIWGWVDSKYWLTWSIAGTNREYLDHGISTNTRERAYVHILFEKILADIEYQFLTESNSASIQLKPQYLYQVSFRTSITGNLLNFF